jgi:3-oxoacyl-[acyl-carrier protein] reductase
MSDATRPCALVIGASRRRGIGRAVALAFAREGTNVAVTDSGSRTAANRPEDEQRRGWEGAASVAAECRDLGVDAWARAMDVTDEDSVADTLAWVRQQPGRLDALVYNATFDRGPDRVPVIELDAETWRRVLDVNLTGAALCTKHAGPVLSEGDGGAIVYISSIAPHRGLPRVAAYAASKAGLHALSRTVAIELAHDGVTSNVVAPGLIDTARVDEMRRDEARWARRLAEIPAGRAGRSDEVAAQVVHLAGPAGRFISGQVLTIDGGELRV